MTRKPRKCHRPAEVLFDWMRRKNGIEHALSRFRHPTTTGKIESWHQTRQQEWLQDQPPCPDIEAAQAMGPRSGRSTTPGARTSRWTWRPRPRAFTRSPPSGGEGGTAAAVAAAGEAPGRCGLLGLHVLRITPDSHSGTDRKVAQHAGNGTTTRPAVRGDLRHVRAITVSAPVRASRPRLAQGH